MGQTRRLRQDISSILISEQAVLQKLPFIFTDAVILDQQFNMIAVAQKVLDFLEYNADELENKSINFLAGKDLSTFLVENLLGGYFEGVRTRLVSKSKRQLSVSISGFYLGTISHLNGFIVLRIRDSEELESLDRQLVQSKADMDNFIYRTSHDLRGPLATIRGLVNLIKLRKNNDDLEMLIPLLDSHAHKLDARLSSLVYLVQADHESEPPKNVVDFVHIEKTLRKLVEQSDLSDFLELQFTAPRQKLEGLNEILTISLFSNLLLQILSFPMSQLRNRIIFSVSWDSRCLNITIGAEGFKANITNSESFEQNDISYMDMVRYPHLVNYYAAKRIASRLNSRIDFRFLPEDNQFIHVTIPLVDKGQAIRASR